MLVFLLLLNSLSFAAGRSLPSGESDPAIVQKIFQSSRGEVHFVVREGFGHSAFLRKESGGLAELRETNGSSTCDEWLMSNKSETVPEACRFVFFDETNGRLIAVDAREMVEVSLFQSVKASIKRGALVTL